MTMTETIIRKPLQPREHEVPCRLCRALTWNTDARCDRHPEANYKRIEK